MAYPPFYSSFTPPFYSFHHQPGVINFTHLCSPSPNLHYQDLNPIPAHSHHLSHLAAENFPTRNPQMSFHQHPPMYNPQPTTTRSFIQQPPIPNPTALTHHNHYHQPISHLEFPSLTTHPPENPPDLLLNNASTSTPLFFKTTEEGEEARAKSQKADFPEILTDQDSTEQDLVVEEPKVPITEVLKSTVTDFAEATAKPTELVTAALTDSANQVPNLSVCSENFVSGPEDHGVDTGFADMRTQFLPHLVVAVNLSVSNFCIDFTFLTLDVVHHSCFEFQTLVSATTTPSPENTGECTKMVFATPSQRSTFIFDPGGTPMVAVLPKRRNHRELHKTVARTVTVAAPPPPRSTFVFDPGGDRDFQKLRLHFPSLWPESLEQCFPTPSLIAFRFQI